MQASKPDRDHEDHAEEGELEAWVRFHKSSYTCMHAWQASKPPHEWSHEDGNDGEAWAGSLKLSFAVKHDHQDALGYEAWFNGPCRYIGVSFAILSRHGILQTSGVVRHGFVSVGFLLIIWSPRNIYS